MSEIGLHSTDTISSIEYSHFESCDNLLAATSWDSSLTIYDTEVLEAVVSHQFQSPRLCTVFGEGPDQIYSGGLDGKVLLSGLQQKASKDIGKHKAAVSSLAFARSHKLIISGSWDSTLKLWDVRQSVALAGSSKVEGKVFSISSCNDEILVATSNRTVLRFDVRNMKTHLNSFSNVLKFQLRDVAWFPNAKGFVASSIEGRVAVQTLDTSVKKFTFKCHRKQDLIYPVHKVRFHPDGALFTGGGDGKLVSWDISSRKKLSTIETYETSVADFSFNKTGTKVAVAVSYAFEKGQQFPVPRNRLVVRTLLNREIMSKSGFKST